VCVADAGVILDKISKNPFPPTAQDLRLLFRSAENAPVPVEIILKVNDAARASVVNVVRLLLNLF
jgi:hypothetical protein